MAHRHLASLLSLAGFGSSTRSSKSSSSKSINANEMCNALALTCSVSKEATNNGQGTPSKLSLKDRLHSLPGNIINKIRDFTFSSSFCMVVIDKDYRPPAVLQVSRKTRKRFADSYYTNAFLFLYTQVDTNHVEYTTLLPWLRSLRGKHLYRLRHLEFEPFQCAATGPYDINLGIRRDTSGHYWIYCGVVQLLVHEERWYTHYRLRFRASAARAQRRIVYQKSPPNDFSNLDWEVCFDS